MMRHSLNIFYNDKLVGTLGYESISSEFDLEYSDEWKENGFAISPILGLDGDFTSIQVKNFIDNLLPEGKGLEDLSILFQISKANKFALIEAIGKETSGALSFLDNNEFIQEPTFRPISEDEMYERIKQRESTPITVWDEKPRLSVAGVQEKLPICKLNKSYGFGDGSLCSTHILKFSKKDDELVINEFLSMKLAQSAGLDVANVEIVNFKDELVLEVERFDRKIISDEKIEKIHVIDSCQALGVPTSYKYERNFGNTESVKDIREGVSFLKLDKIVSRNAKIPLVMRKKILEWCIVNLILANSDAHGKNISFFVTKDGLELTPFYDIVNIDIYDGKYETGLAMAIDDEFDLKEVAAFDIAAHCFGTGLNTKLFAQSFEKISKSIQKELESGFILEETLKYNKEFVEKYKENVLNRIIKFNEIVKIAKDLTQDDL